MAERKITVRVAGLPWTVDIEYEQGARSVFPKESIEPDEPPELTINSIWLGDINMDEFFTDPDTDKIHDRIVDAVNDSIVEGD